MLARCCKCGRPVYAKPVARLVECPYCFARQPWPYAELPAAQLDWRASLCQAVGTWGDDDYSAEEKARSWLQLVGDGEAERRLSDALEERELNRLTGMLGRTRSELLSGDSKLLLDVVDDVIRRAGRLRTGQPELLAEAAQLRAVLVKRENARNVASLSARLEKLRAAETGDAAALSDIDALLVQANAISPRPDALIDGAEALRAAIIERREAQRRSAEFRAIADSFL